MLFLQVVYPCKSNRTKTSHNITEIFNDDEKKSTA